MLFWRVNSKIEFEMLNGPGSRSMESLHGGALLDREFRKIVKEIDVKRSMWAVFNPSLFVQSYLTFYSV